MPVHARRPGTRLLDAAAAPLSQIADHGSDHDRAATGAASEEQARSARPRTRCATARRAQLDAADAALGRRATSCCASSLDGDPEPVASPRSAVGCARARRAPRAAISASCDPNWQRERLQAQLADVAAHARTDARGDRGRRVRPRPRARARRSTPPPRRRPAGPRDPGRRARRRRRDVRVAARGSRGRSAPTLAAAARAGRRPRATIPLLPAAYKQRLRDAVAAAEARACRCRPASSRPCATAVAADPHGLPTLTVPRRAADPARRPAPRADLSRRHRGGHPRGGADRGRARRRSGVLARRAAAGQRRAARRAAWRALCAGRGSRRAALDRPCHAAARARSRPRAPRSREQIIAALTDVRAPRRGGRRRPSRARASPRSCGRRRLSTRRSTKRRVVPQAAIDTIACALDRAARLADAARVAKRARGPAARRAETEQATRSSCDKLLDRIGKEIGEAAPSRIRRPPKPPEVGAQGRSLDPRRALRRPARALPRRGRRGDGRVPRRRPATRCPPTSS